MIPDTINSHIRVLGHLRCTHCREVLSHVVERDESTRTTRITFRHPDASFHQPDVLNLAPMGRPAPIQIGRFQVYDHLGDFELNFSMGGFGYATIRRTLDRLMEAVALRCNAAYSKQMQSRRTCVPTPSTSLHGPAPRRILE